MRNAKKKRRSLKNCVVACVIICNNSKDIRTIIKYCRSNYHAITSCLIICTSKNQSNVQRTLKVKYYQQAYTQDTKTKQSCVINNSSQLCNECLAIGTDRDGYRLTRMLITRCIWIRYIHLLLKIKDTFYPSTTDRLHTGRGRCGCI